MLKLTEEKLKIAITNSISISETLKKLDMSATTANYKSFHKAVKTYKIDTSHFLGQSHLSGKSYPIIPLNEILVKNSQYLGIAALKKKLINNGLLKYECYECGISNWRNKNLSLQLDHINGVSNDHRLENLRFFAGEKQRSDAFAQSLAATADYFVQDAFGPKESKTRIVPVDEELSARSIFFCNDTFFDKFYWNDRDFHIMIHACAVVNLCWPSIGRGIGCFLRCHLWDFAGSWPIIRRAGMDLRRISDGRILERVEADLFDREPVSWHMKEYYLVSNERNYHQILSKIVQR